MPITNTDVIDGPNVQASGEHRGTLRFTFDDGREITRNVRAPDASSWANLAVDLPAQVEQQVQEQDADEAVDEGADIADVNSKQASKEQQAVAYLRRGYAQDLPYHAYLIYARFNTYRLARGWNLTQVAAGLASAGMTEEEWETHKTSYQYLSQPARVTAMEAYQPIIAQWEGRESL